MFGILASDITKGEILFNIIKRNTNEKCVLISDKVNEWGNIAFHMLNRIVYIKIKN